MREIVEEKILKFLYFDNTPRTSTEICYYIEGSIKIAGEYGISLRKMEHMGLVARQTMVRTNEHNLRCQVQCFTSTVMGQHQHELFEKNKKTKVKKLDFRDHILTKEEAASRR